jgi:hypothetical protein
MVATLQAIATAMQDIITLVPQVTSELTTFSAFLATL